MKRLLTSAFIAAALAWSTPSLLAFCGFYVAKADAQLFNQASEVVLVRDGDRTAITMASDYRGEPDEFAMVVPVPTVITRDQIRVVDRGVIAHLDAFSAPRLVEYFDADPCRVREELARPAASAAGRGGGVARDMRQAKSLGVTIEAQYTVGEYDILILSASDSQGLERWLRLNEYRIPRGASAVLRSYIRQDMKFFVAKVNLEAQARLGYAMLRPIQVTFTSPKFMLPIRLGTVNASGPQDLLVYALTRRGRVETTNYRTVKLPSGQEIPVYVRDRFADFYRSMFAEQVRRQGMTTVFTEYAWDMGWCDPCAADPLTPDELRQLGVWWLDEGAGRGRQAPFLTRLHVRYDGTHFPEDLVFQTTADTSNFQGRYVLRHAWTGDATCAAADRYRASLRDRHEQEARQLAVLTGWNINDIRRDMRGLGEGSR
ncbi:MAG: DUF2330 domain-containing protein [Vicinamibacterales bacterium]